MSHMLFLRFCQEVVYRAWGMCAFFFETIVDPHLCQMCRTHLHFIPLFKEMPPFLRCSLSSGGSTVCLPWAAAPAHCHGWAQSSISVVLKFRSVTQVSYIALDGFCGAILMANPETMTFTAILRQWQSLHQTNFWFSSGKTVFHRPSTHRYCHSYIYACDHHIATAGFTVMHSILGA